MYVINPTITKANPINRLLLVCSFKKKGIARYSTPIKTIITPRYLVMNFIVRGKIRHFL